MTTDALAPRGARRRRVRARAPGIGVLAAIAALVVLDALFTPGFLAAGTIRSILVQAVTTTILGAGMTLVIATGGIDLSVGSLMAVASAVLVDLLPRGTAVAVIAALAVAGAIGTASGLLVARYKILPIVVTLAVLIIGRGIAQLIVAGNPLVVFTNPSFEWLGKGQVAGVPVQVPVALAATAAVAFVVRSTVFGRYVLAAGGNERAARLAGVPVDRVKVIVYAASGLFAGIAGLVETARLAATDAGTIGTGVELDAIVAAVVGGTPLAGGRANVAGTALGALLMSMLGATLAMHLVPHAWSLVVKATLLVGAVYLHQRRRT